MQEIYRKGHLMTTTTNIETLAVERVADHAAVWAEVTA